MMDEKQRLLHKFSKGECTSQELELLFKYLKEDKASDYEQVMDEVWEELRNTPSLEPRISDAMFAHIEQRIRSGKSLGSSIHKDRPTRALNFLHLATRTAAVFAAIVLSAWIAYLLLANREHIHETAFGETSTVKLPDSSVVIMNGNSRIRYNDDWHERDVREVWLTGEAFFAVTHTRDHQKFIVHTNNLRIEVLGTEFNVNHRRGETEVTLASGAIRLNGKGRKAAYVIRDVIMHPGDQAVISKNQEFQLKKIDAKKFTAWKDDVMIFDHTPVHEIAAMIEETYGLTVVLKDSAVHDLKLVGSLPANDIEALLGMLKETLSLKVTREGDRVIISAR